LRKRLPNSSRVSQPVHWPFLGSGALAFVGSVIGSSAAGIGVGQDESPARSGDFPAPSFPAMPDRPMLDSAMLDINIPEIVAEVEAVFARYEDALVNNRIEILDELFWDSPSTVRYGIAENLVGIEAIRAFRSARPPANLARRLARTVITTYGRDMATAMTEFHREGNPKVGRQSQTWVRFPQGWRVVAAHVSFIGA
jgi:hypothetical protein